MTSSKAKRGFALLSPERIRELAKKGGLNVPKEKRSFSQNRDLAAAAAHKGGISIPAEKRSFSQDRKLAASAGRKGGNSTFEKKNRQMNVHRDEENLGQQQAAEQEHVI